MEENKFSELKDKFLSANTTKYFFDKFIESEIIDYYSKNITEEKIIEEINKEHELNPINSLVYIYIMLFMLHKKNSKYFKEIMSRLIANNIARAKEVQNLFKAYTISNNYNITTYNLDYTNYTLSGVNKNENN